MRTLLDVLPDRTLELAGKKYRLVGNAGGGGSSIVYLAEPYDAASSTYVMIKELFPQQCCIIRAENDANPAQIVIPPDYQPLFDSIKKRAQDEPKTVAILRNDRTGFSDDERILSGKSNNPWILNYSEPIEANGTLYTVIDTKSGKTLKSLIDDGFFSDKSVDSICDLVLMILDALEYIHALNYLHLDIAPDNILVPEYISGFERLVHIHLIDYNSALSYSCGSDAVIVPEGWISSCKKGYSAPELYDPDTYDNDVCFATDLYSVAAIFFELIVGKRPEETTRGSYSTWKLTNESGKLEGASNRLVDAVNSFLLKGISITPECRFPNVGAMRDAINSIRKIKASTLLLTTPNLSHIKVFGREKELQEIDEKLRRDSNVVFIEGMGGIGKSELARKYPCDARYKGRYDIVQLWQFDGRSLKSTIASRACDVEGFDYEYYKSIYQPDEIEEYIYLKKSEILRNCDERTLIIIDNFNAGSDDLLSELLTLRCRFIITTRNSFSEIYGADCILPLTRFSKTGDLLDLFYNHYTKRINHSEATEQAVIDIIEIVNGHTITVELIAKTLDSGIITPTDMLTKLKSGLNVHVKKKVMLNKDGKQVEEEMYEHIRNVLDISGVCESKTSKEILMNMSLIPYCGINKKLFLDWIECDDYDEVDNLIKKSWLREDKTNDLISLHPVVSDVVCSALQPNSEKCENLVNSFIFCFEYASDLKNASYIEQKKTTRYGQLIISRITDQTELTAELYSALGLLYYALADYEKALEYIEKALLIELHIFGERHADTAMSYNNIGVIYNDLGDYVKALTYHAKALEIQLDVLGGRHIDTAISYNNIGLTYSDLGDYTKALKFHKKSLCIRLSAPSTEPADVAISYNNMGLAYSELGFSIKALKLHKKALEIKLNALGEPHPDTAVSYNNIGTAYFELEKSAKALEYLNKALEIRLSTIGDAHPDTAISYDNIGMTYLKLRDFEKALDFAEKALEIRLCFFGERHPDTAISYDNTACVYRKLRNSAKVLELHKKALETRLYTLGEEHPDTIDSYSATGTAYIYLCDFKNAFICYKTALRLRLKLMVRKTRRNNL